MSKELDRLLKQRMFQFPTDIYSIQRGLYASSGRMKKVEPRTSYY